MILLCSMLDIKLASLKYQRMKNFPWALSMSSEILVTFNNDLIGLVHGCYHQLLFYNTIMTVLF